MFTVLKKDDASRARLGLLRTPHGEVRTPAFLPIGTKGAVKTVTSEELAFWGAEIILANTYHLWQEPGDLLIAKHGGLHKFMNWQHAILTDSGGFQVYSLGARRDQRTQRETEEQGPRVIKISDEGVKFQSERDGEMHVLTPERSIQIQANLGSDIALVLDDVPSYPAEKSDVEKSLSRTTLWASRAKKQFERTRHESLNPGQKLFGIVQGGVWQDLRLKSSRALRDIGFDGYAIGGLAVGEPREILYEVLSYTIPCLEEEKPRHLLGVGMPEEIIQAVARGVDLFDCVLPLRNGRHGYLFVRAAEANLDAATTADDYFVLNIRKSNFREDFRKLDSECNCYLCLNYTRAYLRHLFVEKDPLAQRLTTMHNLRFYLELMEKIRRAIQYGGFEGMI
jgi:queuine tRNA-ribosyltransferase